MLIALLGAATPFAPAATISWTNTASGNWNAATNWSPNQVPGVADDAIIAVAGDVTVTVSSSVTIRSVQCSNHLVIASGTFRAVAGPSVVQGQLWMTNGAVLSATGALTSFTATGPVNANGSGFEVIGGADISLPNLVAYSKGASCGGVSWRATGTGSLLDFSGLVSITGGGCAAVQIQALNGGTVSLPQLVTLNEGLTSFLADGTNSSVHLGVLSESLGTSRLHSFEARNAGLISMPQFPGGQTTKVILQSGGTMDVAQLRELNGFTVSGMAVNFSALTNLTTGNITVQGGAVVNAPNLTAHQHGTGCEVDTWEVEGVGSVLNLSGLTNLAGPACGSLALAATSGGTFILSNLPAIAEGTLYFRATGTNSLLDLGALGESPEATRTLSFEARSGGVISMPEFHGGPTVQVTLESGGVLPAAQMRELNGFTVSGMAVDFSALTNLTPGNVLASGGAVVTVPHLRSHTGRTGCFASTWEARGAGSLLDLPALTNLAGRACGTHEIKAAAGGRVNLNQLPALSDGNLAFVADGTNSVVDLSALRESLAASRSVSFTVRNGGVILMPIMEGGPTVTVTVESGGQLAVAQMRLLSGLTVSGTTLELPLITNLFSGNLIVRNGGVLRLPNLFRHEQESRCSVSTWEVSGAGSVLDLSSLTNVTGNGCGELAIKALAGGMADLSNLQTISEGRLSFLADGTNSVVDLAALITSLATARSVSLEVRSGGTIAAPQFTGGPTVAITLRPQGQMPVAQLTRLAGITVSATAAAFSSLTNFDGGALVVTNGATVTASKLLSYARGDSCAPHTWLVRDAGSVADFSGLGQLTSGACAWLDVQALNGGQLYLDHVTNLIGGTIHVLSSGAGSVIGLRALGNYLNPGADSRLTATNGGTILLNDQPFFLSGVAVAFAAGSPGLPQINFGG
ncbi:MAG TPA: hypothetical protein VNO52_05995, partial [Methylomirabilota bacterium]|nr:hypothetical protein [Methylomirabilota bacterium]